MDCHHFIISQPLDGRIHSTAPPMGDYGTWKKQSPAGPASPRGPMQNLLLTHPSAVYHSAVQPIAFPCPRWRLSRNLLARACRRKFHRIWEQDTEVRGSSVDIAISTTPSSPVGDIFGGADRWPYHRAHSKCVRMLDVRFRPAMIWSSFRSGPANPGSVSNFSAQLNRLSTCRAD